MTPLPFDGLKSQLKLVVVVLSTVHSTKIASVDEFNMRNAGGGGWWGDGMAVVAVVLAGAATDAGAPPLPPPPLTAPVAATLRAQDGGAVMHGVGRLRIRAKNA